MPKFSFQNSKTKLNDLFLDRGEAMPKFLTRDSKTKLYETIFLAKGEAMPKF